MFLFISSFTAQAIPHDSAYVNRFIKAGRKKLQEAIDANERLRAADPAAELQLLVTVDPPQENDYVLDYPFTPEYAAMLDLPGKETEFNQRLNAVYQQSGIECYMLLINALEVNLQTRIDSAYSLDDLFGGAKFFKENSDIDAARELHGLISNNIRKGIYVNNRKCLMQSIGCYKVVYKDSAWTSYLSLHYKVNTPGAPDPPYFNEIKNYMFAYSDNSDGTLPWPQNISVVEKAVSSFEHAARNAKNRARILNTFHKDSLRALFSGFSSGNDYMTLSVAERLHSLSVLVRDDLSSNEEVLVVNLAQNTPQNDVPAFLQGLEKESTLNTRVDFTGPQAVTEKNNHRALIGRIMDDIEDHFGGPEEQHYALFCKGLSALMTNSPQALAMYVTDDPDNFQKRLVYWYNYNLILIDDVGVIKYEDIAIADNAQIGFTRKQVIDHEYTLTSMEGGYSVEAVFQSDAITLRAFDILVFQNMSNLSMLESAGAEQGELVFVPAIFLQYAADKQWNSNAIKSVALAVDAVTLATGPGFFWKAARAGQWCVAALEAAQIAGSVGNIIVNTVEITDPEVKHAVDLYNMLVGAVGFTRLAYTVGTKISIKNMAGAVWNSGGQMLRWTTQQMQDFIAAIEVCLTRIKTGTYAWKDKLLRFYEYVKYSFAKGTGNFNISEIAPLLRTNVGEAFFWSGKTNGIGGAERALEIATSKGGTTLEGVIESKSIQVPAWDLNNPVSVRAWQDISASYANQVSGHVRAVVGQELRPGNIWETIELPRLKANPNVTKITTIDPVTLTETVIYVRP